MKKRLLILPLLAFAGAALSGCGDNPSPKPDPTPDPDPELSEDKLAPDTIKDSLGVEHERVSEVEDNGRYLFGFYRNSNEEIRLYNGEPHVDEDKGKEYPFYLGTSLIDDGEEVEIETKFVDDTHFTMQVKGEGSTYDEKYLGIYMAESSYGNYVYSWHQADELDEKFEGTVDVNYYFEMIPDYGGYKLGAPVIEIADERVTEDTDYKFCGSGVDGNGEPYISIDCVGASKAINNEDYAIAFFYKA